MCTNVKVIKKKGSNRDFNAILLHNAYIMKIGIRRMHIGYNK